MLSRLTIGVRLGLAFATIVLLMIAATGAGLYGLDAQRDTTSEMLDTHVALARNAAEVRRLTLEERRLEKEIFINVAFLSSVRPHKQKWDEAHQQLLALLDQGAELAPTEELRGLYEESEKQLIAYSNGFAGIYARIEAQDLTDTGIANMVFGQFNDEVQQLDALAAAIEQHARQLMGEAAEQVASQYYLSRNSLLGFAVLAVLIAIGMAVTITRSIIRPLQRALDATRRLADGDLTQSLRGDSRDETGQLLDAMNETNQRLAGLVHSLHASSDSVLSGAHEVLTGSQALAERTSEQVIALQQTASSMSQITGIVRQNSEVTEQASRLAMTAARTAESGGRDVEQSIELMQELAASSQKINDIIQVIDSIAFQTNILALNASVEAARAGEQGRGFAVVANEVRTLASRSADSASEIRQLIEEISSKINDGARQAAHSGESIRATVESINRLSSLMQEVASGTREQSAGIEQIDSAIRQMDDSTRHNARLVEQSRSAAEALEDQAEQMKRRVESFRIHHPASATPAPALQRTMPRMAHLQEEAMVAA